jgi:hypothetical protein
LVPHLGTPRDHRIAADSAASFWAIRVTTSRDGSKPLMTKIVGWEIGVRVRIQERDVEMANVVDVLF